MGFLPGSPAASGGRSRPRITASPSRPGWPEPTEAGPFPAACKRASGRVQSSMPAHGEPHMPRRRLARSGERPGLWPPSEPATQQAACVARGSCRRAQRGVPCWAGQVWRAVRREPGRTQGWMARTGSGAWTTERRGGGETLRLRSRPCIVGRRLGWARAPYFAPSALEAPQSEPVSGQPVSTTGGGRLRSGADRRSP